MDVKRQKELKLTSQQRYNIISDAMDLAEDDGFLNYFVFNRAVYVLAAKQLLPDEAIQDETLLYATPILSWDTMIENGVLEKMAEEYPRELTELASDAEIWFNDRQNYVESMQGIVSIVKELTDGLADGMTKQLEGLTSSDSIGNIIDLADKWGMNNVPPQA